MKFLFGVVPLIASFLAPGIAAADSAVIVNEIVVIASTGGNSGGDIATGDASASASLHTEMHGEEVECATVIETNGTASVSVTVTANGEEVECTEGDAGGESNGDSWSSLGSRSTRSSVGGWLFGSRRFR